MLTLFKHVFYTKYVSVQIRKILAYILDKALNKIIVFKDKKDKVLFLSGNYSLLALNQLHLTEHIKTPYIIVYNENLNETYVQQYHANFHAYGFTKTVFKKDIVFNVEDKPLKQSIRNFRINTRHNRVNYTATLSIVASSYDELLDIITSLTSLLVPNRYYLHNIPVEIEIPNQIRLQNPDIDYILTLSQNEDILKEKYFSIIGKDRLILTDIVPVYFKIDTIAQNPLPLFETQEFIYRAETTIYLDLPIIKMIELSGIIPLKGLNLKVIIEPPNTLTLNQVIQYNVNEYIIEQKLTEDTNIYTFTISIDQNEELLTEHIYLGLIRYNEPIQETIFDVINIYLPFTIQKDNEQSNVYHIKVNYLLKNKDTLVLKYYTINKA